jgi:hypothetical protein
VPEFPAAIEERIDQYLARLAARETGRETPPRPAVDNGVTAPGPAAAPSTISDTLLHRSRPRSL